MFPSSHDIADDPRIKEACFTVLGKLLESGNQVLVTTKPRLPVTKDIVYLFSKYIDQMQFRFTITSSDNSLLKFWEPNAPTFEERVKSLAYAFNHGFKTSVSIEPFLDRDPRPLVETISRYVTKSIWLGIMNYIPRNSIARGDRTFYEEVRENYTTHRVQEICEDLKYFPKIRFKDSIGNKLALLNREAQPTLVASLV